MSKSKNGTVFADTTSFVTSIGVFWPKLQSRRKEVHMKATQIVLLFNLSLGLLASLPPGRALAWDTTNAMKNPPVNADQKAKDFCLGNKCGGYLESATVDVDNQNLVLHGRFNLHNVQEQCIRRPFGGKWCWDIYNYYVHIDCTGFLHKLPKQKFAFRPFICSKITSLVVVIREIRI